MSISYPQDFRSLSAWAAANGFTMEGARVRYAQYVVLYSLASVRSLREAIVFKGGNALDLVWNPNRSTIDLDFSLDHDEYKHEMDTDTLKTMISQGIAATKRRFDMELAVNSMHKQPPGEDKTFITFTTNIGYALPTDVALKLRMSQGRLSPKVIPIEISLNEPICESVTFILSGATNRTLRVSSIEDIVGEKLRSLLQQPLRNRSREQDVLDIALLVREHVLDVEKVAKILLAKAEARNVKVSKAAFHDPEIARRASLDYDDALRPTARRVFIPFEEAFNEVLDFVERLPLPANHSSSDSISHPISK